MSEQSVGDAMKAGAETATRRRLVGGLDGAGWVALLKRTPMATLPPGAVSLVVEHLESLIPSQEASR